MTPKSFTIILEYQSFEDLKVEGIKGEIWQAKTGKSSLGLSWRAW